MLVKRCYDPKGLEPGGFYRSVPVYMVLSQGEGYLFQLKASRGRIWRIEQRLGEIPWDLWEQFHLISWRELHPLIKEMVLDLVA